MTKRSIYLLSGFLFLLLLAGFILLAGSGKPHLPDLDPDQIYRKLMTPKLTLEQAVQAALDKQKVADGEFYFIVAWSEVNGMTGSQKIQEVTMSLTSQNNPNRPERSSSGPSHYSGTDSHSSGSGSCVFVWSTPPEGIDKIQAELEQFDTAQESVKILVKSGVKKSD